MLTAVTDCEEDKAHTDREPTPPLREQTPPLPDRQAPAAARSPSAGAEAVGAEGSPQEGCSVEQPAGARAPKGSSSPATDEDDCDSREGAPPVTGSHVCSFERPVDTQGHAARARSIRPFEESSLGQALEDARVGAWGGLGKRPRQAPLAITLAPPEITDQQKEELEAKGGCFALQSLATRQALVVVHPTPPQGARLQVSNDKTLGSSAWCIRLSESVPEWEEVLDKIEDAQATPIFTRQRAPQAPPRKSRQGSAGADTQTHTLKTVGAAERELCEANSKGASARHVSSERPPAHPPIWQTVTFAVWRRGVKVSGLGCPRARAPRHLARTEQACR